MCWVRVGVGGVGLQGLVERVVGFGFQKPTQLTHTTIKRGLGGRGTCLQVLMLSFIRVYLL